jgi:predicted NUDIX family NTP pyrophosphohydrolase
MRRSAGIVLYRLADGRVEVMLGHMGGPFWARKDSGAWTIPKGEYDSNEDALVAACREFDEEIGVPVPATSFADLGEVRQPGGKVVRAFAAGGDLDASTTTSNTFEIEWPPKSGRMQTFPELDRVEWFDVEAARTRIIAAQRQFLDRLLDHLSDPVERERPDR